MLVDGGVALLQLAGDADGEHALLLQRAIDPGFITIVGFDIVQQHRQRLAAQAALKAPGADAALVAIVHADLGEPDFHDIATRSGLSAAGCRAAAGHRAIGALAGDVAGWPVIAGPDHIVSIADLASRAPAPYALRIGPDDLRVVAAHFAGLTG